MRRTIEEKKDARNRPFLLGRTASSSWRASSPCTPGPSTVPGPLSSGARSPSADPETCRQGPVSRSRSTKSLKMKETRIPGEKRGRKQTGRPLRLAGMWRVKLELRGTVIKRGPSVILNARMLDQSEDVTRSPPLPPSLPRKHTHTKSFFNHPCPHGGFLSPPHPSLAVTVALGGDVGDCFVFASVITTKPDRAQGGGRGHGCIPSSCWRS